MLIEFNRVFRKSPKWKQKIKYKNNFVVVTASESTDAADTLRIKINGEPDNKVGMYNGQYQPIYIRLTRVTIGPLF